MISIQEVQTDTSLMNDFVQENLGLVKTAIYNLGLRYSNEDYFQEGCIGLVKAIKRYNPEFGIAFSTYAIPLIQGEVMRYRRDYEVTSISGVKVSRSLIVIYNKSNKLKDKGLCDKEICDKLGITLKMLNNARKAMTQCASLDECFTDNEGASKSLYDIIPLDSSLEDDVTNKISIDFIIKQLNERLNKKQSEVLRLHLQGLKQTNISRKLGISQPHVGRILRQIITIAKEISEKPLKKKLSA